MHKVAIVAFRGKDSQPISGPDLSSSIKVQYIIYNFIYYYINYYTQLQGDLWSRSISSRTIENIR